MLGDLLCDGHPYALGSGTDTEYLRRVQEVEEMRDKRLFIADAFRQYELQWAQDEYEREKAVAQQEFEVPCIIITCTYTCIGLHIYNMYTPTLYYIHNRARSWS